MKSILPLFTLLLAGPALTQQAGPALHKAVTPQYAGTFSPLTGFIPEDKFKRDTTGTPEEIVFLLEWAYCSTDTNPNGLSETITIYDESVYCAGPTNWPVFDCGYSVTGLPGGNNGALACWIVSLDLTGVECNVSDGHGGHAGWGQIWESTQTGPWLASGGNGQTPTYTWFDIPNPMPTPSKAVSSSLER